MFNSIPIRRSFLPEEGCKSVEDTMRNFQIEPARGENNKSTDRVESVSASSENPGLATVTVSGGGKIIRSEATVRRSKQ